MKKQTISPERVKGILTDVQFMSIVAQLIENRFHYNMIDANLRNPVYRNSARQIVTAADRIKKEISLRFNLINKEALEYDVSEQLDRVITFFMMLPAETIDEIMTDLEKQLEEVRKEAINDSKTKIDEGDQVTDQPALPSGTGIG